MKEILLDLFLHAYRTSPEFYYPYEKSFSVFDREIVDRGSNLKFKAIDCIVVVLERQGLTDKVRDDMLGIFSADTYHKIMRKLGKGTGLSIKTNRSGLSGG